MRVCLWIEAKIVTIATNLRVITTDLSGNNLEDIYTVTSKDKLYTFQEHTKQTVSSLFIFS